MSCPRPDVEKRRRRASALAREPTTEVSQGIEAKELTVLHDREVDRKVVDLLRSERMDGDRMGRSKATEVFDEDSPFEALNVGDQSDRADQGKHRNRGPTDDVGKVNRHGAVEVHQDKVVTGAKCGGATGGDEALWHLLDLGPQPTDRRATVYVDPLEGLATLVEITSH